MANAGVLISWEDSKVGREGLGAELWMSSMAFYQRKVEDGTLDVTGTGRLLNDGARFSNNRNVVPFCSAPEPDTDFQQARIRLRIRTRGWDSNATSGAA